MSDELRKIYDKHTRELKYIRKVLFELIKSESAKLKSGGSDIDNSMSLLGKIVPLQLKLMPLELKMIKECVETCDDDKDMIFDRDIKILNEYLRRKLDNSICK